jgi:hypothetical protein
VQDTTIALATVGVTWDSSTVAKVTREGGARIQTKGTKEVGKR